MIVADLNSGHMNVSHEHARKATTTWLDSPTSEHTTWLNRLLQHIQLD